MSNSITNPRVGPGGVALGQLTEASGALRSAGRQAIAVGAVGAGGALTGYLASGRTDGAVIGTLSNLALFGLIAAVGGQAGGLTQSTTQRVIYGLGALAAGAGAGYLFWTRR